MKKKKTIFILGIFLVLLIGVYGIIIMNNKKQKEEETTQTETQETKKSRTAAFTELSYQYDQYFYKFSCD